jgi:hypothetical protein
MTWNFWKKKPATEARSNTEKLHRPQDIPQAVGRDLIVNMGKNPDWVWRLKCVVRRQESEKSRYDFRVYDETEVAKAQVKVRDYTSFDEHLELILFHGWFDKKSWTTHIEEGSPKPLPKAA